MELMNSNTEWKILETKAERHDKYYPCCKEPCK